jgi:hypothetical protein
VKHVFRFEDDQCSSAMTKSIKQRTRELDTGATAFSRTVKQFAGVLASGAAGASDGTQSTQQPSGAL